MNMLWKSVENLFVFVHNDKTPTQDEWDKALKEYKALVVKYGARARCIVATDGGGPNSVQRNEMAAAVARHPPTAICSDSTVVRAMMQVFKWLNVRDFEIFKKNELVRAAKYLDVSSSKLMTEVFRLQCELKAGE